MKHRLKDNLYRISKDECLHPHAPRDVFIIRGNHVYCTSIHVYTIDEALAHNLYITLPMSASYQHQEFEIVCEYLGTNCGKL